MIIKVNGVNYRVDVKGKGAPVLFLHGFTGATENWLPFYGDLETQFMLISVDILGHGKSDSPENADRYLMEEVMKDIHSILQVLKIKKTSIVGYSMGGRLALSFAAAYPEMVRCLILESSSPGLQTDAERKVRSENDQKLAKKILEEGIPSFVAYWEDIPLFDSQKRLPADVRKAIRRQRLKNNAVGLANSLIGMGTGRQPSKWDELQKLQFPVLLLCGEEDFKFCKIATKMDKLLPNSKKIVIKNSGHTIHVEQPKIFGKIVKEYLKVYST